MGRIILTLNMDINARTQKPSCQTPRTFAIILTNDKPGSTCPLLSTPNRRLTAGTYREFGSERVHYSLGALDDGCEMAQLIWSSALVESHLNNLSF
jgi:hypothetical protein